MLSDGDMAERVYGEFCEGEEIFPSILLLLLLVLLLANKLLLLILLLLLLLLFPLSPEAAVG